MVGIRGEMEYMKHIQDNSKIKQVHGVGPIPCDILILGEAPGKMENSVGRPLVGKTGEELNNTYLPILRVTRDKVRIDNVIQFRPAGNRTPSDKELTEAMSDVYSRVAKVRPKYIIALGNCSNFVLRGGIPTMIERIHGRPYKFNNATVIPCIHPAAGFRDGQMMLWCLEDFQIVADCIQGKIGVSSETRKTDYTILEVLKPSALVGILEGQPRVAIDTEDIHGEPFSVQLGVRNGSIYGVFISISNSECIKLLMDYLMKMPELIFHHSIHDVAILERLGFRTGEYKGEIHDTMVIAHHMGNQPKGLKSLAYRWLNEEMTDYLDVVRPYQNKLSLEYLEQAALIEYPDIPRSMVWKKAKVDDIWDTLNPYKPQNIGKRVRNLLYRYNGYPEAVITEHVDDYRKAVIRETLGMKSVKKGDIGRLWLEVVSTFTKERVRAISEHIDEITKQYSGNSAIDLLGAWNTMENKYQVTEKFGDMLLASLRDVPHSEMVDYAVRDAINTYLLWEVMK